MFGTFNRSLDNKNRIIVPSKLRDALGSKFYMTIGLEGAIELRSEKTFNDFISILNAQSNFSIEARKIKRAWLGNTQEIEVDSQGRFLVPKTYIEKAAIQKDVVLVGIGDLVELWSLEKYNEYNENLDQEELNSITARFAEKA
ncbi:cell division protein MraZ [Mycoplasmopsis maculosa]|uniref:Transcriptional regulator MraZ n=1 Tax=Mycoplasmopsis maculosa TaxID=114885 RepID=A0A449B3X0_9BACT|nr:division/cell wall cluster transcriptional repressor MraZ [Mycoplasmopsis maculosa]VEU75280.1 cell division protein MraZ [Mycoplasmopsis maculosa]